MKARPLMILLAISGFCFGINSVKAEVKTAIIERTEKCLSNPEHSYKVFVPSVNTDIKSLPLLVIIEPNGNGKNGIEVFKTAAQKNNAVIVASNFIKFNDTTFIEKIDELIADVKRLYPVSDYTFIAALPGLANMAVDYASGHRTDGIISFGVPDKSRDVSLLKCKTIFIISLLDFNFNNTSQMILDPTQIPSNVAIEIIKDPYSRLDKKLIQQSLSYLMLSTVQPTDINERKQSIKQFVSEQKQRIDSLCLAKENLQASIISRNLANVFYYEREGSFLSLADEIKQNPDYQSLVDKLTKYAEFETKVCDGYLNSVIQKDSVWWKEEINLLNSKINTEKDQYYKFTFQRIKGYLGIVCYAMCNRFATENDAQKLEQVLLVYRIAEPDNADVVRFSDALEKMKLQQ